MNTVPQRDWLHRFPPLRTGRRRHHHHHFEWWYPLGLMVVAMFVPTWWMCEVELWLLVWYYYGLFLLARWTWRQARRQMTRRQAHLRT